jgi:O-antigen/teichoic acid export membrane protein
MEFKVLVKNTSYLITTRVFSFLSGIIRSKLIAVLVGVVGAGIISQIQVISQKVSELTLLSMNDGLVKEISETKGDHDFREKLLVLLKSYIFLISIFSVIAIVLLLLFSNKLTFYFFGNNSYRGYYLVGIISFPILIINSISFSLLKGFKDIKNIARSEMISLLVNLLFFLPLIYYLKIMGGIIYIIISFISIFVMNRFYARKTILKKNNISGTEILKSKINPIVLKKLFVFVGFGLTAGMSGILVEIISRIFIVNKLGIESIGIYSPIIAWSSIFTGLILPSIYTYLFPRLSEIKDDKIIVGILNDTLRLVTLLMLPVLFISISIRFEIIPLFYSKAFISSGNYLPGHFLGLLFFLWMNTMAMAFTPTGRIKIYTLFVLLINIVDLLVVVIAVPKFGLYGWMLKFIISPILFYFVYLLYYRKKIAFKLARKNNILMLYTLAGFITIYLIDFSFKFTIIWRLIISLVLTCSTIILITKEERKFLKEKINLVWTRSRS